MDTNNNKSKQMLIDQIDQPLQYSPSAFMKWLSPVVRAVEHDSLTFEYIIREEMTNPMKTLHGGITAAIIDDAIGATVICMGRAFFYTTVNNAIDYFATAKLGEVIQAKTKIIKAGRQIINVQCEIWHIAKNRIIARGYSNMLKTEILVKERGSAE
ncbi:PaaI family thioesterase [Pedobacter sp. PWIIR3]